MQHTLEARHGKNNNGQRAARSSFLVATVALSLALPGLAQAQAPGATPAPQAAPDSQAMPDAPGAQAPPEAQAQAAGAEAQVQAPQTQPLAAPTQLPVMAVEPPALAPAQPALYMTAQVDEKHEGFALGGSLLSAGAGVGMMIVGISGDNGALGLIGFTTALVGPSFGNFYAGEYGRGLTQVGVRAGAAAMTVGGVVWMVAGLFDCLSLFGEEADCSPVHAGAPLLTLAGLGLGAGSIIHSIQDAPRAARRYNAKARARQLTLIPAPMSGPDRTSGLGMQLTGSF